MRQAPLIFLVAFPFGWELTSLAQIFDWQLLIREFATLCRKLIRNQLKGYLHVSKASTKRLHVIKVSIAIVFVTGNKYFQNLELLERFDHIASSGQNKFKKILNLKVGIEQIVVDEQSRTLITLKPSWKRIHICKMSTSKRKKEHKKLKQQRAKVYTVIFELTTLASIVAWIRDETRSSFHPVPFVISLGWVTHQALSWRASPACAGRGWSGWWTAFRSPALG